MHSLISFDMTLAHYNVITEIAKYVASKGSQTITSIWKSIIMVNVANVLNKCMV